MAFKFEKLVVWQRSLELSVLVSGAACKFPKEEMYVLSSQIKRAADSVCLNIAEGSTGQTNAEFNRFLAVALRSDIEIVACIFIARGRNIISSEDFEAVYKMCEEILVMINALRRSLKQSEDGMSEKSGSSVDGKSERDPPALDSRSSSRTLGLSDLLSQILMDK